MGKRQDELDRIEIKKQRKSAPFKDYYTEDYYSAEDVSEEAVKNNMAISQLLDRFDVANANAEQIDKAFAGTKELRELKQATKDVKARDEAVKDLEEKLAKAKSDFEQFKADNQANVNFKQSYESEKALRETAEAQRNGYKIEAEKLQRELAAQPKSPSPDVNLAEIDKLKAENDSLREAIKSATDKQNAAIDALESAKNSAKAQTEEIASLRAEVERLKNQQPVVVSADPDEALRKKLAQADAEKHALETQLAYYKQQAAEIPAPAADPDEELREKYERAKGWVDTYAIRAQNLESNLRSTQEALEEAKNARIRAEANKANLEGELKESEEEIVKLQNQLTNAEQSEKVLNLELKNCRNEINVLRSQLNAEKAAAAPKPESIPAAPVAPAPVTAKAPKPTEKQMVDKLLSLQPTVSDRIASTGAKTHVVRTINGKPVNKAILPILQEYLDKVELDWKPAAIDPEGNVEVE